MRTEADGTNADASSRQDGPRDDAPRDDAPRDDAPRDDASCALPSPTGAAPCCSARVLLLYVAIAAAAVLPYLGILDAPFVFDDKKLVEDNLHLATEWTDIGHLAETFNIFSRRWKDEEIRPNYRPLRFLSYYFDYQLSLAFLDPFPVGKPPPFFFHLSNVLFHALNAVLVALVARRLLQSLGEVPSTFVATLAGLMFALHPLQTEAVTYVSGRRDVLFTFFFLLATVVHLGAPADRLRWRQFLLVPGLLVAGLLTKETAATLPGALLLIDGVRRVRWTLLRGTYHTVLWGLALAFIGVTVGRAEVVATPAAPGWDIRLLDASRFVWHYLALTLAPLSQSVDYSYDAIPASVGLFEPLGAFVAAAGTLLVIGAAFWALFRCAFGKHPRAPMAVALLAFGVFWFLGTLLPVLQFVPIAERFGERFAYLPVVACVLVAAVLFDALRRREKILGWATAGILCVVFAVLTVQRNDDWKSPLRLWTSAVEAQPRCARARLGRANALRLDGRRADAALEYTQAIEIFEEASHLPLHQGFILQALTFRAEVNGQLGEDDPERLETAILDYRDLLGRRDTDGTPIESSDKHTMIHFNLAGLYLSKGATDEAAASYERVVALRKPKALVAGAHYYLGKIRLAASDLAGAGAAYREALRATPPGDPAYLTLTVELAELLLQQKAYDEAWDVLAESVRHVDGDARLNLRMRQAKVLDRKGEVAATRDLLDDIVRERPSHFPAVKTLADVLANTGEFDRAIDVYKRFLEQNPLSPEALEGLKGIEVRRRAHEAESQETPAEKAFADMEALLNRAREDVAGGRHVAAHDTLKQLLLRTREFENKEMERQAYIELASIVELLGRPKIAAQHLAQALAIKKNDPAVLRQMADLQLRRLQNDDSAREYYLLYMQALPIDEEPDPLVLFNLAQLEKARTPLTSLAYLNRAAKLGYDAPRVERLRGFLHAELNEWQSSFDAFERYLERIGTERPADAEKIRAFLREVVLPKLVEEP